MNKLMLVGGLVLVVCLGCQTLGNRGSGEQSPVSDVVEVQVPHPGPVVVALAPGQGVLTPLLAKDVEDGLARRGFRVGGTDEPDAQVQLTTSWRVLERLNDWSVWEGAATVRVTHDAVGGALLGTKTVLAKSVRGTDEKAAQRDVSAALKGQLEPWMATVVTPKLEKRKVIEQRPVPPAK